MNYEIAIVDRVATFVGDNRAVQHCVRGDTIEATFDTEWNEVTQLVANFVNRADGTRRTVEMRDGGTVAIPWECMRTQGELYVTFIGYIGDVSDGGTRLMTCDMDYPFIVQRSTAVELVVPEATEDVLQRIINAADDADGATSRATVAAIRAEEAAEKIGTSTVTRTEFDEQINIIAGILANYVGRIWYLNKVLYVPAELASADDGVLRFEGTYDEETKTLWIGEAS